MSQVASPPPEASPRTLPGDMKLYEVIGGEWVEKPSMGSFEMLVGSILDQLLGAHARSNGLGRVVAEMLFKINPAGNPKRRPDVAFVSYARWPREKKVDSGDGWDVVPDLCVEVVSPSNTASEIVGKVREYFEAGARRVWVVYPVDRLVYVHESPKQIRILGLGDELDGEDLLPGFRLGLAELFEDGAD